MKNFDEIKNQWEKRNVPPTPEIGTESIIAKSNYILKKQRIGQIVLGTTIAILLCFFFYISAYNHTQLCWGLGIMVASLLLRMIIEYGSSIKKEKLPVYSTMNVFNQKLIAYYTIRKRIHFFVTPLLFVAYVSGFVWLLPLFEQHLSRGFYSYIFWSSIFIFAGLAILIIVQIRKELYILKHLKK